MGLGNSVPYVRIYIYIHIHIYIYIHREIRGSVAPIFLIPHEPNKNAYVPYGHFPKIWSLWGSLILRASYLFRVPKKEPFRELTIEPRLERSCSKEPEPSTLQGGAPLLDELWLRDF